MRSGQEVEIEIGEAPGVVSRVAAVPGGRRNEYLLTVTNDQSYPVRFAATFRTLPGTCCGAPSSPGATAFRPGR